MAEHRHQVSPLRTALIAAATLVVASSCSSDDTAASAPPNLAAVADNTPASRASLASGVITPMSGTELGSPRCQEVSHWISDPNYLARMSEEARAEFLALVSPTYGPQFDRLLVESLATGAGYEPSDAELSEIYRVTSDMDADLIASCGVPPLSTIDKISLSLQDTQLAPPCYLDQGAPTVGSDTRFRYLAVDCQTGEPAMVNSNREWAPQQEVITGVNPPQVEISRPAAVSTAPPVNTPECQAALDWIGSLPEDEWPNASLFEAALNQSAPELTAENRELIQLMYQVGSSDDGPARLAELADQLDRHLHDICNNPIMSNVFTVTQSQGTKPVELPCYWDRGVTSTQDLGGIWPRYTPVDCGTGEQVFVTPEGGWSPDARWHP